MFNRLVAGATALSLFALPAAPVLAHPGHGIVVESAVADVAAELDLMLPELTRSVAASLLADEGYTVGVVDDLILEAALRSFPGDITADALPVTLPVNDRLDAVVFLPLTPDGLADGAVPLIMVSDDGRFRAYSVSWTEDRLTVRQPDGAALVDVPVAEVDGDLRLNPGGMTIFAFDIPIDFSLDGLIGALQQVLDLLYTVKGLLNSIICAVQGAVDLLYGLDNCGIGTTTIGGGELAGRIQCAAPKVKNFIQTVTNYCF